MTDPTVIPLNARPTTLAGQPVWLMPEGALFVPGTATLVVSDLHFEKGSAFAAKGQFLPPYDTRATLTLVERLVERLSPRTVISLGDTFHDPHAERRMAPADAARLERLCDHARFVFILGNHDPLPPGRFCGHATERYTTGGLTFVHEPEGEGWNVAGHLHPCAVVEREGRRLRRRCFVGDGTKMILPALGAFTGGLNVLEPAFAPVFGRGFDVTLLGRGRLFAVSRSALRPEGAGRTTGRLRRA